MHGTCPEAEPPSKRSVEFKTFLKWKQEVDKECLTISWLECDAMVSSTGKKVVKKLQCRVCSKFEKRLCSKRNYSSRWVTGATSFKVSGNQRSC